MGSIHETLLKYNVRPFGHGVIIRYWRNYLSFDNDYIIVLQKKLSGIQMI